MKNYFKIAAYFVFVAGIMGTSASAIFAFSSGPPDGRTGSPADSFNTCKAVGCHDTYVLNSGSATFSITAPANYTLGADVPISISFGKSSTLKHGFELSALDANNKHVGVFSSVDDKTQTNTSTDFIKHTLAGDSQAGNASWNVKWTAPASAVEDPVTFYAAGNEANGDFTHDGDYIYTTTAQSSAGTLPPPTCEPESISTDTKKLNLALGESGPVIATVGGPIDCDKAGTTVNAVIKTGKKRATIDSTTATTDENGQATFTITAGEKKGNATVLFTVKDSKGKVRKTKVVVKIK